MQSLNTLVLRLPPTTPLAGQTEGDTEASTIIPVARRAPATVRRPATQRGGIPTAATVHPRPLGGY